jgi:hypothetical protein
MLSGPPSTWLPFESLSNREGRLVTVRMLTIDHFVWGCSAHGQPPWMTPSASRSASAIPQSRSTCTVSAPMGGEGVGRGGLVLAAAFGGVGLPRRSPMAQLSPRRQRHGAVHRRLHTCHRVFTCAERPELTGDFTDHALRSATPPPQHKSSATTLQITVYSMTAAAPIWTAPRGRSDVRGSPTADGWRAAAARRWICPCGKGRVLSSNA